MGATNFHTRTLSGSVLSITSTDNVTKISIVCKSGSVTYKGNRIFKDVASQAIVLNENQGVTITERATSTPIDGITIDASGGVADIILSTF